MQLFIPPNALARAVVFLKGFYPADPELPDGFGHDAVFVRVVDTGGAVLGRVRAIHDHGAGDILEIYGPSGVLLIPFTRAAVPMVDLAAKRIVADPPGSDE